MNVETRKKKLILLATLIAIIRKRQQRRTQIAQLYRPKGRRWTRDFDSQSQRDEHSWFHTIIERNAISDPYTFKNFTRMNATLFTELANLVGPFIARQDTQMRRSISVGERLGITLRYLATGDSYQTIAYGFHAGTSTVSEIIKETCEAIFIALERSYLQEPTPNVWRQLSHGFGKIWNSPNCIGAIDGKHIPILCPPNAGSEYYNYKGFHSIVMMAVVSPTYRFTFVDIGAFGSEGDRNVYESSGISKRLREETFGIPQSAQLPYSDVVLPMFLVGDEAFPLKPYLMKPFTGRTTGMLSQEELIFNYRTSRSRRVSENVFGIWASRFRLFAKRVDATPENVEIFAKAAVVLHNFLSDRDGDYCPRGYADHYDSEGRLIEGGWRQLDNALGDLEPAGGMNYTREAKDVREALKQYYSNEGEVPWQYEIVNYDGHVN